MRDMDDAERENGSQSAATNDLVAEAFQTTLDLFEFGLGIMRQNLKRTHPEASDEEIGHRLRQWLHERPGDCDGPIVDVSSRHA